MKKRSYSGMSICLFVMALYLSSDPAFGMIRTLPLSEMIARSDFIIVGRVTGKKKVAQVPKGPGSMEETIENILVPQSILKGKWPAGKTMHFTTHQIVSNGRKAW